MHHNSKDRLIFEPLANSSWILRSLAIALLFSSASISNAQRITASLGGIVRDSSAAVIPNARVSIANTGTQVTTKTQTNGEGRFEVSNLPPGPYSVAVDASGFKRLVRSGLVLNVDQTAPLEIVLDVGPTTETVQVNSVEPLLETQSSDIGQVIGNRSVENLQLNQRNPFSLVLLAPGVTGSVNASFTGLQFNVNGARAGNTDVLLDGVLSSPPTDNVTVLSIFPSVDATQEFKVQTSNFSSQFGNAAGGIINIVYKSGTNNLHGSVYDYLRNSLRSRLFGATIPACRRVVAMNYAYPPTGHLKLF
ncbi:carboxypeptidase-like regulatory domain-containing protein [Edaphobacter aggregans]|uniref:carboxypeptidase-like regulatory domain-containing protein n=1 Tax=Edaphobacter aggregans TaxID=570835 RepID=UPI00054D3AA3|nr:carboxypeptidase-like regulatory domain-containing protein [Edaphobacter aggregans]